MTSWFFIEMAAKSALICSIALLLAMALKGRAAADRATVLRVGAGLLMALPLIALAFPVLQIEAFAAPAAQLSANLSAAEIEQLMVLAASAPAVEPTIWDDPTPLIVILWAAGAVAVMLRLLVGLVTLHRWTRAAEPATDPFWLAALERARIASGATDRLRLMVADKVPGPLGWGLRNPVILIDHDTYTERDEADAILAHEVAHVARRDWPALMMTRLATALFWFNPLVWTLARESIHQAEEAADAHAARVVDPTRYAETLLSWGQIGRGIAVPANSIAPGARALSRRVRAVLDARLVERSARSRVAVVAVLLCVGVAAPVAALELVEEGRPPTPPAPAPGAPSPPNTAVAMFAPRPPAPGAIAVQPKRLAQPETPLAPEPPKLSDEIALDVDEALEEARIVLPRIPHIVATSLRDIDERELGRALRHSGAGAVSAAEMRAVLAEARAALPNAEALRVHLKHIDTEEIAARVRASLPDEAALERHLRSAMRVSRSGMEQGARQMERGADRMEAQGRRLRHADERERIIVRERARGRTVTHEELIEAADGLVTGAQSMRGAADAMRRGGRHSD